MKYGYALKLVVDENIRDEMNQYFSMYDIVEIKVKNKHLDNYIFIKQINELIKKYNDRISLHLEADLIENFEQRSIYFDCILKKIERVDFLVTHIQNNTDVRVINSICDLLPNNTTILLENESGDEQFIEKIKNIKSTISTLHKDKVKICFDLGHCKKESEMLKTIVSDKNMLKDVVEIHIHSNIPNEHSRLKKNDKLISEIVGFMNVCENLRRAIFEIKKIDVLKYEGIEQIKLIDEKYS
ncbi:hypothetical protein [Bulleidia sp. zg-1006]|uniref:hypothetical protein n=1 Tax=Bulleidia sp. zg-1006 TaxID=2806552 RepID=UPI0019393076|nr:hypothetical protein [Bulleidia sp. zg-1006]QRG87218.1 hypothetical protein JOS54_02615 [Bulleidia sp. zg-1006]